MKPTILLSLAILVSSPVAAQQEDPAAAAAAAATKELLGRGTPFEGLDRLNVLGAYRGLKSVGTVELSGILSDPIYNVTSSLEISIDRQKRKIEVEAKLRLDLTVDEYKRVDEAIETYVYRRIEETIRREGDEWVIARTIVEPRRDSKARTEEGRVRAEPGILPEGLAAIVGPVVHDSPEGKKFAFRLLSGTGRLDDAVYEIVGTRRFALGEEAAEGLLVRMTRTSAEKPRSGGPHEVLDRADYYVGTDGALQKIESTMLPVRYLALPEDQLGKDLVLAFEDDRDVNRETPVEALVALFDAMERESEPDIDARVDFEQFFGFIASRQTYQAPGGKKTNIKMPAEMIRQAWQSQGVAHTRALRGQYFSKKMVPYGSDLAKKLEAEVDGKDAKVVRGGGLPRTWHMSRESGVWKVVGYEEEEEE